MKATGSRFLARTPTCAMCFSTSYLLSKCGMPVCRLAEPTEVKTRCTPAALAASAAAIPCRISASVPPDGTVIAKREAAPSSAFLIAAVSSSDAATSVAPAFASNFAWLELGSRVTARTLWPRSRRPRATAPPCWPVDPVTTTVSCCFMFMFSFCAVTCRERSDRAAAVAHRRPQCLQGSAPGDEVIQHRVRGLLLLGTGLERREVLEVREERQRDLCAHGRDLDLAHHEAQLLDGADAAVP